jgi:hypothetical protein
MLKTVLALICCHQHKALISRDSASLARAAPFKLVSTKPGAVHCSVRNLALQVVQAPSYELRQMSKEEYIIQLVKVALGILVAGYFLWWSLEVLKRLPPPH